MPNTNPGVKVIIGAETAQATAEIQKFTQTTRAGLGNLDQQTFGASLYDLHVPDDQPSPPLS